MKGLSEESSPLAIAAALRQRLRVRAHTFGSWVSIGHPEIASLFASGEGHFVGVDLEHTTTELSAVQHIIRACHEQRRACLVRISPGHLEQIQRVLDAGADGIIVPQISSVAQIDHIAAAVRYPPDGSRSYGVAAAHRYGRAFDAYVQSANASLSLTIQIETSEGVQRVGELVAHPAVDGVMVGPYDLSGSMGIPGQLADSRVRAACALVAEACAKTSKGCGLHLVRPSVESMQVEFARGFTFLVLGSDVFTLWQRGLEVDEMIRACTGSLE